MRLDQYLVSRFNSFSRSYFQNLIEEKLVLVNGEPVKKRVLVKQGDEIEIQFSYSKEINLVPKDIPLNVLYEDQAILAIDKPKNFVVHPAPGHWEDTFANALLYRCQSTSCWSEESLATLRPGIVHRLDKDTTGVLIAAKNLEVQQKLSSLFAERRVYKEYLAICIGTPKGGKVDAPIGRHPRIRQKMAIVPQGRPALSFVDVLHSEGGLSLVKVVIATGRTHQVRLHLNYLNTPVLGDALYGNTSSNSHYKADRPFLHAFKLRLPHPLKDEELALEAPIPSDMASLIQKHLKNHPYAHFSTTS
ncbi:MAG: RluA family pseudouridine synthase [Parachlamydiaceae bacterium]